MLKHKVGDVVTVRPVEEASDLFDFLGSMRIYCDKKVTITEVNDDGYCIKEDNGYWNWVDEYFTDYKEDNNMSDKMNKLTQIMNILGIEKYVPIDLFDEDGDTTMFSPYVFDGKHMIDCGGDENDQYLSELVTGVYTFKPANMDKAPTKNTPDDTNVYVRDSLENEWEPAHFAGMTGNPSYPYAVYEAGMSSFTADGDTENFKYAKLAK